MRNLKRVLSLALASVMLLGMMVVGAGAADAKKTAADLTDMDKVANKEAVSLLVDLAIIEGKTDGTFDPTGIVDRATMAKLVYKVLQGDADESIYSGGAALKDVPAGHWAEGFINYCYSVDIIAGDGTGNFMPGNKVTTVAAAKMLLVALGYDAADRGYVNDAQWSINIMKDAQKSGLLDNVAQAGSEELTRDTAALMIFNALMASTVTPEYDRDMGEKYIKGYTKGNSLGYETYSLLAVTAKVDSISDGKAVITALAADTISGINITNVSGKIAASSNVVGQNVTIYVKAGIAFDKNGDATSATFKDIYTSSIQTSSNTLLATSAKGLTIEKLTEKKLAGKTNKDYLVGLSPDDKDGDSTVTYYLNGVESTDTLVDAAAAKGVVINFYDVNGDGLADVVKVLVKKVSTLTADPKTKTDDDGNTTVLIKGAGINGKYITAVGYEGLSEDDVVLYYADGAVGEEVYHFELADSFTGTVTATKSDKSVRVDGTYYTASGMAPEALNATAGWDDFDNEYTFYTDNGGYVVKADTVGEKTSDKYAIVLETAWVSGGGVGASKYMEAKVLFSDGTTEIVKVSKIGGKTVVAAKTANGSDNTAGEGEVLYKDLSATDGFYTYTVKDEKYQITAAANKTALANATITNAAKFTTDHTANSKTVFVVEKTVDGKSTYTSYTGFGSIPKMTAKSGIVVKTGSIASYVFLSTEAFNDDAPEGYVYIKDASKYAKDSKGNFGYDVFDANGDEDTLWVDDALDTDLKGLCTVGALSDGIATKAHVDAVTEQTGLLAAIGDDIVTITGDDTYTYDTDTIFVVIDAENETATSEDPSNYALDTTNYVYTGSVIATNGVASYIYVVVTNAP